MSRSTKLVVCVLFGLGLISGSFFLFAVVSTAGPHLARGAEVTQSGWTSLIVSFLGTFGLTGAGVITALWNFFTHKNQETKTDQPEASPDEITELVASFTALIRNKTSFAAQRRFIFALADAARLIVGVDVSHEGGVLTIKYSGFVQPINAATPDK